MRTEAIRYRKDGTPVYVEGTTVALRGERGEVTGYVGITRDVTERKRFEAEQQRLVDIVQKSSDFIGIADRDWRPLFVNEAGQKLVGLHGIEEIRRTLVPDYLMPEDRAFLRDELITTVMEEGRWTGEFTLRHFETGEPIPVIWDVFRIDDSQTGEPINIATVTRDITKRKRAEEEIGTRARQQAVVAEVGLAALASGDLQLLMDEAVSCIARTLDLDHAKIVELLPG